MSTFATLKEHFQEIARYETVSALLDWDQQTYMPTKAAHYRADQAGLISGLIHQRMTDPRIAEWLEELENASDPEDLRMSATVRNIRREYQRATKLPQELVEQLARCTSKAQNVWVDARRQNEFSRFAPALQEIIELKQQQADAIGYVDSRYDALLDEFEPEMTTAMVKPILDDLRNELVPFLQQIFDSGKRQPVEILHGSYPVTAQTDFAESVAAAIGFDFGRGRVDLAPHPFCTTLGPNDCRITTRYDESFFSSGFFSVLHEAGHGLYEQGLPTDWFGLPPGKAVSLGIHESQSRLWENQVGRSLAFWRHYFPVMQRKFLLRLMDVSVDDWFAAINDVRPSLIRVEADEATYNLHIIIRFELEQELLDGSLSVSDAPEAWNDRYEKYLGIRPDSDANGILQDVHWSCGLIGYFPTYSLGNLYAAQLFEQADNELGGIDRLCEQGEFAPLRHWLRDKVHQHGQCYSASDLISQITGRELSHTSLMKHLRQKLSPLYHIE